MKPIIFRIALLFMALVLAYGAWVYPRPARRPVGDYHGITRPDGAKIAYYISGHSGPYVMLMASLGRSVSDFNELALALNAAGFRTIGIEARGVGAARIGHPAPHFTLFDLADDAAAARDDAGIGADENIFLVGHAFGNRAARAYATQNSETVRGLVLLAAGGAQKFEKNSKVLKGLRGAFKWWLPPPVRKSEIHYAFFADGNAVPGFWMDGWSARTAQLQVRAVAATPLARWRAGGGRAPMLIIQAAQDRIAPAAQTSAGLKKDFPERVRIVSLDRAGHALLPERPDAIARAVTAFFKDAP